MTALKKNSVAFMIMLLCIVLSVVIGINRKDTYINAADSESKPITTIGVINQAVQQGVSAFTETKTENDENNVNVSVASGETETETSDNGIHISFKGILIIIVIILIIKGSKKH